MAWDEKRRGIKEQWAMLRKKTPKDKAQPLIFRKKNKAAKNKRLLQPPCRRAPLSLNGAQRQRYIARTAPKVSIFQKKPPSASMPAGMPFIARPFPRRLARRPPNADLAHPLRHKRRRKLVIFLKNAPPNASSPYARFRRRRRRPPPIPAARPAP